ncbi:MAG: Flagellar Assembly Protein, partial [Firmicutes bacterium]|nr:Flagellar Assembly Protein [Bacillota bacterium]
MSDDARFLEQADDKVSSLDGYFNITTDENSVYLAVYPPQGDGQAVKAPQIIEQLAISGIGKAENALLVRVVKEALGTPVKVADKPIETEPDIQILTSRDRMESTLQVNMPKGCRSITIDDIMDKIKQAGIVYGIDNLAIESAINRPGST